jgi:CBS-domain-containing membrane protein
MRLPTDLSDCGFAAVIYILNRYTESISEGELAMRAMDAMTAEVISVNPDTSVQALAALLSERGIGGIPVVDADHRMICVVSQGDLLHRVETATERRPEARARRRRSWWLDRIASDRELARDYLKSHGRTVKDVMTPDTVARTRESRSAPQRLVSRGRCLRRARENLDSVSENFTPAAERASSLAAARIIMNTV